MSVRPSQFGWHRLIGSLLPIAITAIMPGALVADPGSSLPSNGPVTDLTPSKPRAGEGISTTAPVVSTSVSPADGVVAPDLLNRTVEEVRVTGNAQVPLQTILNQVGTHVGDKFVPEQVKEDYQRIYALKGFSNVQAKVEPTGAGVIVIFQVTEEKLIKSIEFAGNKSVPVEDLRKDINLKVGEAIERFRVALAKRAIIAALRAKNHPFSHVEVDMNQLTQTGKLVFNIVEGAPVAITKIDFVGNHSFTANELDLFGKLNDQIKSRRALWILEPGNFDPEIADEDVASLRHFYQSQGFFDVKVGRKLIFSPDQTALQINYLIDEGPRYRIAKVSFVGNNSISEAELRKNFNLVEGKYFDSEVISHDVKEIIKAYSPRGYVVDPNSTDQAYLQIGKPDYPWVAKVIYHKEPGTVDLVYEISEGRPFRLGSIHIKGNTNTQDKLVLRELHLQPGQLYNSGELNEALERIRALPEFAPQSGAGPTEQASITPIGSAVDTRDILIDVHEQRTANIQAGGGIDSNLGLQGNVTFEQKNFDITKPPARLEDLWSGDKAFVGAGQIFTATFQPGVDYTNARISFTEPYVFDQPYSNTDDVHYDQIEREDWYERRLGGAFTLGTQITYNWSTAFDLGVDDVYVGGIVDNYPLSQRIDLIDPVTRLPMINPRNGSVESEYRTDRAPEIIEHAGHNVLTNIGWSVSYDDSNRGPLSYRGTRASLNYRYYGGLGGDYHFNRFIADIANFTTIGTDALDRKTVLELHVNGGYITPDAPFFERFYGGGLGSLRGFEYRGVGPRSGRALDPVGGNFALTGTAQVSFPLYGDNFRGVVFTDLGTVEQDIRIHTIRQSIGAGIRVSLPFLGNGAPLAFDLAVPVRKGALDSQQIFSFGVGASF